MTTPRGDDTPITDDTQHEYIGRCPHCETAVPTDDPNDLVAFFRRHHRVTGHQILIEQSALDLDESVGQDVVDRVRRRQGAFDNGVPIGIVAVEMSAVGVGIGETLSRIHDQRLTGALYEPVDDHLRAL